MAKNKATMRDIAKECNVSVATVSYVLNHSEKEKIRHETRLKVMETATRLHYVPSILEKGTSDSKSNLVGIIINLKENNTTGKKLIYYDLAAELSNQMRLLGFEAIIMTTKKLEKDVNIITTHSLDAVFMIDVDNASVQRITRDYYVPIIFLDCEVNDLLFCKIHPDYPDLIQKAKGILGTDTPFLIMEDIFSQILKEQITDWFLTKDVFINTPGSDLKSFLQSHKESKGIILGDILALQAECFFDSHNFLVLSCFGNTLMLPHTPVIYMRNKDKAIIAAETLKNMLRLGYQAGDGNQILLKCGL